MKKSTKKVINYLRQYVGNEMLRTRPTYGDWSYMDNPILLVGFTSDGCIKYRYTGLDVRIFGNEEFVLPLHFTDRNWITYKKALKAKGNELNKWRGKKIIRIRPTEHDDCSFMSSPSILVSASKYHMVINHLDIEKIVLRSDYMNPEDWKLAE